jgi:hypothetical protein
MLSSVKAQDERDPEKISFGIGVELYPMALAGDFQSRFQQGGFANFIAPIQLGPHILIEPELGIYIYNQDQTLPDSVKEHSDQSIVRTGFGVFYSNEPDKSFEWYLGARLGILSSESHTTHSPVTTSHAEFSHQWGAFYTGAAFGVEYFFSPHFAIGGELQINHIGYGAPIIDGVPWTPNDSTHSVWSTNASVTARFYF